MGERYTRLFTLPDNLYAAGAPVVLLAGALLKDNQTGKVLAQLKMQNIDDKPIKAVTVHIAPLDTVGKPLGAVVNHPYLDLNVTRDQEFGQKVPLPLPNAATRAFSASVSEVIFSDNTIWTNPDAQWEALSAPVSLEQAFADPELITQFRIQYGNACKYLYQQEKGLWRCVCGALNHADEPLCHKCQKEADVLARLDLDELKENKEARLALARQQAASEQAAAAMKAKKTRRLAMIIIPLAVIAIAAGALVFRNVQQGLQKSDDYHNAVALMEAGKYDEAIALLEALGDYKDSAAQIEEAERQRADAVYENKVSSLINTIDSIRIEFIRKNDGFDQITDYIDEAEWQAFIILDTTSESQKDGKYRVATALLQNEFYENAMALFEALGDYKDSAAQKESIQAIIDEQLYAEAVSEYPTSPQTLSYWKALLQKFSKISPDYLNTAQYVEELTSIVQSAEVVSGTYYGSSYTVGGETRTSYFTISGGECETDKPVLSDNASRSWHITDSRLAWSKQNGELYGIVTLCDGWGNHVIKKIIPTGTNSILVIDDTSQAGKTYQTLTGADGGKYSTYSAAEETYTK